MIEKSDIRTVNTKFGETQVCDVTIQDEFGDQIKLTLWGEQTGQVNLGDDVRLINGYVSEFRGEVQLNVGKKGRIEVE